MQIVDDIPLSDYIPVARVAERSERPAITQIAEMMLIP